VNVDDAWVALGEVTRPHGVRGELRVRVFNPDSDALLHVDEVRVRLTDGTAQLVSVDAARKANDALLLRLHSVDSRERADELRGATLEVPRSSLPEPDADEYYAVDLIGATVRVLSEPPSPGVVLGTVRAVQTYPTVDVLLVKAADGGRDWEVPLLGAVVARVDLKARQVELTGMEGVERA
jgi:16S rRNA processing protein RimM